MIQIHKTLRLEVNYMATKLFVGGLSWGTTDETLQEFFAQIGQVISAVVIKDKFSGQSKGFGFVEFSSEEEAKKAVDELNGKEFDGRSIIVNEARPQEPRPSNFSRPYSGGGGRDDRRGGSGGGRDFRSGGGKQRFSR